MLDCSAPLRTPRVCMDRRDRAAIPEGVLRPPDAQPCIGIRIGRLENEAWEISRTMNDVLARAACDLKDDSRRWQDIAKDIENEIAIAQCRRRILAVVAHLLHGFRAIPA